jgi:hypothetical protein
MHKAKLNYWVDLASAVAAAVSLLSGLIFLLPPNMASVGPDGFARMLGLTLLAWSDVHTISSLAMIAGVGVHLALHGRWIRQMTTCVFRPNSKGSHKARKGDHCPRPETAPVCSTSPVMSRRRFVTLGWLALVSAACAGTVFAAKELFGPELAATPDPNAGQDGFASKLAQNTLPTRSTASAPPNLAATPTEEPIGASNTPVGKEYSNGRRRRGGRSTTTPSIDTGETLPASEPPTEPLATPATVEATPEDTPAAPPATEAAPTQVPTPTTEPGEVKVACPRGMVWDAYPGHCRLYVDRNGNGYCDYSEPIES